jgi:hypothetical protein
MSVEGSVVVSAKSPRPGRELGQHLPRRKSGPRKLLEPAGVAWELAAIYRSIKRGALDSSEGCRRAMILSSLAKVLDQQAAREMDERLRLIEAALTGNNLRLLPSPTQRA